MDKDKLFNKTAEEYGEHYHLHLFEQYKIYIESAEKISDRRQSANNYFLAINTALLPALSLSVQFKVLENSEWVKTLLALLGVAICIIFGYLIRSYKQLNTGKFAVIHEIEQKLPISLYSYEWKMLGEGKNKKKYYPFSDIELLVPKVFGITYLALCIYTLV